MSRQAPAYNEAHTSINSQTANLQPTTSEYCVGNTNFFHDMEINKDRLYSIHQDVLVASVQTCWGIYPASIGLNPPFNGLTVIQTVAEVFSRFVNIMDSYLLYGIIRMNLNISLGRYDPSHTLV